MPDIFFLLKSKRINIFCWSRFVTVFSNIEFSFFMFRKNDCSYQLTTFPGRLTLSLILKIVFVATATNFMLWNTLLSPKDKAGQSARCTGITHYRGLVQMQSPFRSGEGPETAFPTSPRLCQHCWPTHCKEGDLSKKISNQWPKPRYSV